MSTKSGRPRGPHKILLKGPLHDTRPATGAALSTAHQTQVSHVSGIAQRKMQSMKRGSRQTFNMESYSSHNQTHGALLDPRFSMYNKDKIRNHLDNRRRRAQSNIRPRERFSTITAFQKCEVQAIMPATHAKEDVTPHTASKSWLGRAALPARSASLHRFPRFHARLV